jgi:hypothetical protein
MQAGLRTGWRNGAHAWAWAAVVLVLAGCSLDRAPLNSGRAAANGGSGTDGGSAFAGSGAGANAGTTGGTAGADVGTAGVGTAGTGLPSGVAMDQDAGMLVGSIGGTPEMPTVMCASTETKAGLCRPVAEGIYVIESDLDVWWKDEVNNPDQPLMDPGRGHIVIKFMATISNVCDDGSAGLTELRTCGATLPPFYVDSVCKVIQIEFPEAMWDSPEMPTYITRANVTGFDPGEILRVATVTGLLGINLSAIDAVWPTYQETATFACGGLVGKDCFPDQDMDGRPGVTVHMNPGGTITNAPYACGSGSAWKQSASPLSIGNAAFNLPGATRAHIGLRMALGGEGKIGDDCARGVGIGTSSADIPSRVYSCVVENGSDCDAAEAEFVDQNVPSFHLLQSGQTPPAAPTWQHVRENPVAPFVPKVTLDRSASVGPRTRMLRIADLGQPVNCAQIRDAALPPFE